MGSTFVKARLWKCSSLTIRSLAPCLLLGTMSTLSRMAHDDVDTCTGSLVQRSLDLARPITDIAAPFNYAIQYALLNLGWLTPLWPHFNDIPAQERVWLLALDAYLPDQAFCRLLLSKRHGICPLGAKPSILAYLKQLIHILANCWCLPSQQFPALAIEYTFLVGRFDLNAVIISIFRLLNMLCGNYT